MIKSFFSMLLATILAFGTSVYMNITNPAAEELPCSYVFDSTPKKYFTLSFDDGITQDYKIMEICRKYNFNACTFNINTGLCGENWDWVSEMINVPGVTHLRLTKDQIKAGAYKGFDVEVHSLTHPSLKNYDDEPFGIFKEIQKDAFN